MPTGSQEAAGARDFPGAARGRRLEQHMALARLEPDQVTDGAVATLRLNRPPLNILNRQLHSEVRDLATQASRDDHVRALVLHGGARTFAAGADVKELAAAGKAGMLDLLADLQASFSVVAGVRKPVIAAITGYAVGGGLELALAADFRIASDDAILGQPEVALGLIPCAGGTQRLPRLIGVSRAKDLCFTGRHVGADEALSMGLVDRVVSADAVYEAALELARTFVHGPRIALAAAKEAIDRGAELPIDAGLAVERSAFAALQDSEDADRGMAYFVKHGLGQVDFTGR
jgi:enoyl-CoA hydratase/carnithine racemase